jgi:molecular chaperone DnaK (HSP70)
MKEQIKNTSKKYIVIPVIALSMIAILVLTNVNGVSAHNSPENKGNIAQMLAEKFNLDQTEVEQTLKGFHKERHEDHEQKRKEHLEDKLDQAVVEEKLSEEQRFSILAKFEEMHNLMEDIHDEDLSHDEMQDKKADIHEEMKAWAEDQGIDFELFLRSGKRGFGGHKRQMMH